MKAWTVSKSMAINTVPGTHTHTHTQNNENKNPRRKHLLENHLISY